MTIRFCALIFPALLAASPAAGVSDRGRDELLFARKLLDEKLYEAAATQLEKVLRDYPALPEIDEAQFLLGDALARLSKWEEARTAFLKTYMLHPESAWAPEAVFRAAAMEEAMGKPEAAAPAFLRMQALFPSHNLAPRALLKAVHLFTAAGDTGRAESAAELLVDKYPDSESADGARLARAAFFQARGDRASAERYLEWVASRTTADSFAMRAYSALGEMRREEGDWTGAVEVCRAALKRLEGTRWAGSAAAMLADFLNQSGRPDEALKVLEPVQKSTDPTAANLARIEAGDAWYLKKDYQRALEYYHAARAIPEAALKAAWTAEALPSPETALERYLELADRGKDWAYPALVRAAMLAQSLEKEEQAARLWERAAANGPPDIADRAAWERLKLLQTLGRDISAEARDFQRRFPTSPWADDAAWLAFKANPSAARAEDAFAAYPVSPYLDSARVVAGRIRNLRERSPRAVDRMAELSSRLPGSVDPLDWALDWGDFYLGDLKDPDRALEHYRQVLNSPTAGPERWVRARVGAARAFVHRFDLALWEGDRTALTFADSARFYLDEARRVDPGRGVDPATTAQLLALEVAAAGADSAARRQAAGRCPDLPGLSVHPALTTELAVALLELRLELADGDTAACLQIAEAAEVKARECERLHPAAGRFRFIAARARAAAGAYRPDTTAAVTRLARMPRTPGDAAGLWWECAQGLTPAKIRYDLMEAFRREFPYAVDPAEYHRLAAEAADSLGRTSEALEHWEAAEAMRNWALPKLDLIDLENAGERLRRARAMLRAGEAERALAQVRPVISLEASTPVGREAMWLAAQAEVRRGAADEALKWLDSLDRVHPYSQEAVLGKSLRAQVLTVKGDYDAARRLWAELAARSVTPDSAFHWRTWEIICLYRLGQTDAAHEAAKKLYRDFKDRPDLDEVKARFYYEKGRAQAAAGRHEEALKSFRAVRDAYPHSRWVADADYAAALSRLASGDYAGGTTDLKRFVDNHPDSDLRWDALLSLGVAAYKSEKYPEAAAALRHIWEGDGGPRVWIPAFQALAAVYKDSRFWDALIALTREYLARFPDAEDAVDRRMDMGWAWLQLGEWDEAARQYRSLLPLSDPEREAEAQYYVGEALMAKGDYQSAVLEFLKVKILGRKTKLDWGVTALYKAGNCYEKLGDLDGAARMYAQVIQETGAESNYGRTARARLDALKKPDR